MMSDGSDTGSVLAGGARFYALVPDFVVTWNTSDRVNIYGEVHGISKTTSEQGWGVNVDAGVLFLLRKNLVLDCSVGQRVTGYTGGFERYIGSGLSILL